METAAEHIAALEKTIAELEAKERDGTLTGWQKFGLWKSKENVAYWKSMSPGTADFVMRLRRQGAKLWK